jgi:undecaprenyl-phosphate 4-deoxy-4-formamido-L-arabinose transferase
MDDDLQHLPEEVPTLLAALTDDLDLVYGLSAQEEHGVLRSFASRLVKTGMAGALGVNDAAVGTFRAFGRSCGTR